MSDNGKTRQERTTDKKPVMVYLPAELRDYLEARKSETGLSMSAYLVFLVRREYRSSE